MAAHADQVFIDDLIVQGSAAVGIDASNGESFGFDTLRLKENNLRIHFDDTSVSASFPSNDWRLVANDTSNGGANKFSIEDATAGRTPFTVEASAPSNSLYVEDGGRVGFGTNTPIVNLHVKEGNSPTLRLEQDGSSGFTPQTWDVAGNEANFFIRDATNGSKLPLQIKPSAPTASIFVAADGDVGIGSASPDAQLHLRDTVSPVGLVIENAAAGAAEWSALVNSTGDLVLRDTSTTDTAYTFGGDGSMTVTVPGGFGADTIFNLEANGNLTITGALTDSSDVNRKENISDVDSSEILEKVANLPVKYWSYKGEDVTHIGPMAQDFYSSFELGQGDKNISKPDADGVALASIKALYEAGLAKQKEIDELKAANSNLEERLNDLEKMISNQ